MVDGEEQLNWDELECQLYWLSVYVFNGLGALHKLTVLGGFQQPYAAELAAAHETVSFDGLSWQFYHRRQTRTVAARVFGDLFRCGTAASSIGRQRRRRLP